MRNVPPKPQVVRAPASLQSAVIRWHSRVASAFFRNLLALGCAWLVAASACEAAFYWLEAESPTAGNFPPPESNPYRAKEFWETDLLSGGDWIGMWWSDPATVKPFLSYQFEVKDSGEYDLYAREFYTYGIFRWRVNDGEWHEPHYIEHKALDMVSFRENNVRIALNWFYMGNTKMKAGTNTLRVEPVYFEKLALDNGAIPLAYDVFLFTNAPFFPNGKMKPGERVDLQKSTVFAPEPPEDLFQPCAIDWRSLNEKIAGENGGLVVKGGRFALRNTGEQVRLLGMNISPYLLQNPRATAHFARLLAKKGINLVRIDFAHAVSFKADANGRMAARVNGPLLEKLGAAVAIFKREGIYMALTWNIITSDGLVEKPVSDADMARENSLSSTLLFDPELQATCRSVWKSVLETPVPGAGRLGDDPALAFVTLNQQDTIFSNGFRPYSLIPAGRMEPIEKAFGKWLLKEETGPTLQEILTQWGGEPIKGDQPAEGRVGLLSTIELAARHDRRANLTARFLAETQRAFFENLQGYFRGELGYRGILSPSNKLVANPAALGWVNAWSLGSGDVVEKHGNYLPEFKEGKNIWAASVGSQYADRSALRFDPLPGREDIRFDLPLRSYHYDGKPVFFSELSWPLPNRFRPEMVPLSTTLAALQGVDALCYNIINYPYWQSSMSAERTPAFTPAVMGQMPAFAYAYRQRLLPEGMQAALLDVSKDSLFSLKTMPISENADTQMTASLFPSAANGAPAPNQAPPTLWLGGGIEVRLGAEADRFEMLQPVDPKSTTHEAAEGALKWDHSAGLLQVDAPSCKVACGFLKEAGLIEMEGVEIRSDMEFGTVCLVALDGQPLSLSKKILLQVFSEEANSGAYSEGGKIKTIRSTGQPPILVNNLSGNVRFLRPDADQLITTALDFNGYKTITAGTGGDVKLLPSTVYYLIEK